MPPLPDPIQHTVLAIWKSYEAKAWSGDNLGVPISQAGHECARAIWYSLRWASPPEPADGQRQRRFDTGNIEEERLLDDLEAAGMQIERLDPATGQQFRVQLVDGWLRGKLDGKGVGFPEAPDTVHVIETKSMNDRSFKDLQRKKLQVGKPDHYVQCQLYMKAENLERCLYLAVNKNDDSLYAERVKIDRGLVARIEQKIEHVIDRSSAPSKLFENPNDRAAFVCQWCRHRPQCHEGAFSRFNCRTCLESEFLPGAIVRCQLWNKELSYAEQQKGCDKHLFLPSLVPGEQIDADEEKRTVTYRLRDGQEWMDGKC